MEEQRFKRCVVWAGLREGKEAWCGPRGLVTVGAAPTWAWGSTGWSDDRRPERVVLWHLLATRGGL